jgi:hypothetical protein
MLKKRERELEEAAKAKEDLDREKAQIKAQSGNVEQEKLEAQKKTREVSSQRDKAIQERDAEKLRVKELEKQMELRKKENRDLSVEHTKQIKEWQDKTSEANK